MLLKIFSLSSTNLANATAFVDKFCIILLMLEDTETKSKAT